jgi:hypothetical protein
MLRNQVVKKIGLFDENLDRFEDTDYWRRVSKNFLIYGHDEPTCLLRTHNDNVLHNQNPMIIFKNMNRYIKKINKVDWDIDIHYRRKQSAKLLIHYAIAILYENHKNYKLLKYTSIAFFSKAFLWDFTMTIKMIYPIFIYLFRKTINFIYILLRSAYQKCID